MELACLANDSQIWASDIMFHIYVCLRMAEWLFIVSMAVSTSLFAIWQTLMTVMNKIKSRCQKNASIVFCGDVIQSSVCLVSLLSCIHMRKIKSWLMSRYLSHIRPSWRPVRAQGRYTSNDCDDVQIVNMSWFETDNWRCSLSCVTVTMYCAWVFTEILQKKKKTFDFFRQLQNSNDRDKRWETMFKKFSTPQHFWLLKITMIRINIICGGNFGTSPP